MIRKVAGSTIWYEFSLLQPFSGLRHGCFVQPTLASSPSQTPPVHHAIMSTMFGEQEGTIVATTQEHGTRIAVIVSPFNPGVPPILFSERHQIGREACLRDEGEVETLLRSEASSIGQSGSSENKIGSTPGFNHDIIADAMMTQLTNTALLIRHADCQACLLFDPDHRVIANVHAGWRGTVHNIYSLVVHQMQQQWGTRPESLIACISPSLGPCHALFPQWQEQFPPSFAAFRHDGDLFNFWEIGRHQLMACGLIPEHIETANLCTHCHPEPFLSYRRDKTPLRHGTCIALRACSKSPNDRFLDLFLHKLRPILG